jgi:hypothetical protein
MIGNLRCSSGVLGPVREEVPDLRDLPRVRGVGGFDPMSTSKWK